MVIFDVPLGSACDSEGYLYVVDLGLSNVRKFDPHGNHVMTIDHDFGFVVSIAISRDDEIYIIDNYYVKQFETDGTFVRQWGGFGSDPGQFFDPMYVAVDSDGNVYVTEDANQRVQKFDSEGNYILHWGEFGHGDGQFDYPMGITIDALDNIYVYDSGNDRIQKFDSTGNYISEFPTTDYGWAIYGITFAFGGLLYLATSNNKVYAVTTEGIYITEFEGEWGFEFHNPSSVAVFGSNVYVVDTWNQRIQRYRLTNVRLGEGVSSAIYGGQVYPFRQVFGNWNVGELVGDDYWYGGGGSLVGTRGGGGSPSDPDGLPTTGGGAGYGTDGVGGSGVCIIAYEMPQTYPKCPVLIPMKRGTRIVLRIRGGDGQLQEQTYYANRVHYKLHNAIVDVEFGVPTSDLISGVREALFQSAHL